MSRLDDALREHEKKLREELAAAHKKKAELATELLKLDQDILNTEIDLAEVSAEVARRSVAFQKAQHFVIAEGLYD
jgi:predicted  nucleic acid-binding Zn-ribbon protein